MESAAPRDFARYACQAVVNTIEASTSGALLNGLEPIEPDLLEPPYHTTAPRIVTSQTVRAREPLNIDTAGSDPRPKSADPPAIHASRPIPASSAHPVCGQYSVPSRKCPKYTI